MTAGAAVRLTEAGRMDRLMEWAALIGGGSILAAQYVSNLPYSVYPKSNFWTDNPALIVMRVGISLVILAGCYTWTANCASATGFLTWPPARSRWLRRFANFRRATSASFLWWTSSI